ncbi:hypothetical protein CHS0354_002969 [Potamilus streckersoni]|uniref:Uncharacterized protein n=1 Tax=Potamilus streckersoni TaxID=2493646 RepID=A0AAE0RSR9_9BIVA|nr:hypothetical protein CHS0354_002969 [Potamilus streckersoni]
MESIQLQDFYENSNVWDTRLSALNSEYFLYEFQEKDLDYNWIPLYYSFVEPWDYEPYLKQDNMKSLTDDENFVNTDHSESGSNDGVVRKYKKTRRGHAGGKRKRRGEKRQNVNTEVTDQPNAKRAREQEDINVREFEEQDNMAAAMDGFVVFCQPEESEEEAPMLWSWEKRGRGL